MSEITDHRHSLREAVEPLLADGESVSVTAAPSTYEGGLNRLRFEVFVSTGNEGEEGEERIDELLEPTGGVKQALEVLDGAVVIKSAGHQLR